MAVLFWLVKKDTAELIVFSIVGIGSQVMLLISAIWGFRCMLSLYLVYMLLIGCLTFRMEDSFRWCVICCGAVAAVNPPLAAVGYIAFLIIGRTASKETAVQIGKKVAFFATVVSLAILITGYASNTQTHEANLQRTKNPEDRVIVLEELPDTIYSWYTIPMGEFHEGYYRILHEIPADVEIIYQELP